MLNKRLVVKFGGTSVADIPKIRDAACKIKELKSSYPQLIVIVSAMAGHTNQLVGLCKEISNLFSIQSMREYDAVVSSGENVSTGLLALALQEIGINACSLQAWQIPIYTNSTHISSLIEKIDSSLLNYYLENDIIPVIAGFQGINYNQAITTLGRGGSDTTAVAIAAAMDAIRCDIYTDVEGVFTTDPRIVPSARKLDAISYEEMLELAACGAKVLHYRSVEIAMRYKVPLQVLSTFSNKLGTTITNIDNIMEKTSVTGITLNRNVVLVKINSKSLSSGLWLTDFSKHNVHIDMLSQNYSSNDIMFVVSINDIGKVSTLFEKYKENEENFNYTFVTDSTVISIIGWGVKRNSDIIKQLFVILEDFGVKPVLIASSEIRVSAVITEQNSELILKKLHQEFNLG